jgi:hypothetical protein
MSVTTNTYQIPTLTTTDSFYNWWLKENTDIIAKLNLMRVYGATSGDGVLASLASNGMLTLSIGGTSGIINTPLTFNGAVNFASNPTINALTIQIPGITSGTPGGYTFGTPVYVSHNGTGITYAPAKANSPETAEVFGIITGITSTYATVAVAGKIVGNFTAVNGRGLTAGYVYFLDDTNTGKITVNEPQTTGSVSKPLILGLSGDQGLILTYRGNYLDSSISSYGSSGSNQIVISFDTTALPTVNSDILVGDVLSYAPEFVNNLLLTESNLHNVYPTGQVVIDEQIVQLYFQKSNRKNFNGWFHARGSVAPYGSLSKEEIYIVGVVTDKDLIGSNLYVTIQLSGYTNVFSSTFNGSVYLSNEWDLDDRVNKPQLITVFDNSYASNAKVKIAQIYDHTSNSSIIIPFNYRQQSIGLTDSVSTESSTLASSSPSSFNEARNGNYNIWQRSNIGRNTQYTSTGDVVFADMWRRHDGITGNNSTKNYYIVRQSFSDYQNEVEGSPKYYADIKALSTAGVTYPGLSGSAYPDYKTYDHLMVGHVFPGAKYLDGKPVTVSFYAKTSHSNYNDIHVYFARFNNGDMIDYQIIGSQSLSTSWGRYDIVAGISYMGATTNPKIDDYCEIGIDLIPLITQAKAASESLATDVHVSLASMNCFIGTGLGGHQFTSEAEQLAYCQQFYYSTYQPDESIAASTMASTYVPSATTPYLVTIPNYSTTVHKLPARMRTSPTVSLYSPYSGSGNEAYNYSASRELRSCNGTKGYNNETRLVVTGQNTVSSTATKNDVTFNVLYGSVPYDKIYYHIIADADFPI